MDIYVKAPFSQRIVAGRRWINNDFPLTARTALSHLLHELIDRRYLGGWIHVDKELRRIVRDEPRIYDASKVEDINAARQNVMQRISYAEWTAILDFCERLHSYLAVDVTEWNDFGNQQIIVEPREKSQRFIAEELERLFLEERLGFSFEGGEIRARSRRHTAQQIAKVEPTFADARLTDSRKHFAKAIRYFDSVDSPDYENAIKEAVCAVESAAKRLFPDAKGKTLGDVAKEISGKGKAFPKQLGDTLIGIYAYRNGGEGISHGATGGDQPSRAHAEYVLAVAASQIIWLHSVESDLAADIPF